VRGFFLKKTWRVSLSFGVRITMIRCVVYLLGIYKMFHGLMNNPVYAGLTCAKRPNINSQKLIRTFLVRDLFITIKF